jgi:hypothetical protein
MSTIKITKRKSGYCAAIEWAEGNVTRLIGLPNKTDARLSAEKLVERRKSYTLGEV